MTDTLVVVKKKISIPIEPQYQSRMELGAKVYLSKNLGNYLPQLNGVLVDYGKEHHWKLKQIGSLYLPPVISTKGSFTVLRPTTDSPLPGVIKELHEREAVVITYNVVLARVPASQQSDFEIGDEVVYTFKSYLQSDGVCMIEGADLRKLETDDNASNTNSDVMEVKPDIYYDNEPTSAQPVSALTEDEPLEGFPEGWRKVRHRTAKNTWCTYLSPQGKSLKTYKKAMEYNAKQPTKSDFVANIAGIVKHWNKSKDGRLRAAHDIPDHLRKGVV